MNESLGGKKTHTLDIYASLLLTPPSSIYTSVLAVYGMICNIRMNTFELLSFNHSHKEMWTYSKLSIINQNEKFYSSLLLKTISVTCTSLCPGCWTFHTLSLKGLLTQTPASFKKKKEKKKGEMVLKKVTEGLTITWLAWLFCHRIPPRRKQDRPDTYYDMTAETSFYLLRALNCLRKKKKPWKMQSFQFNPQKPLPSFCA